MNIKRIIREEMEGFKDSTEEDWGWSEGFYWDESVLRDLIRQEGELYVTPYRVESSNVKLYIFRGKPALYYLTDEVPNPPTPDNSLHAEEGSTWTWDEGDLTIGDVAMREWDEDSGHKGREKFDSPLPHSVGDVVGSLNAEKSFFSDFYFIVDKNGEPKWDMVQPNHLEGLKGEYEKFK